ncbi:MAG: bis(5'-nucleosyl)-tetraphosphatase (symmetrical) YqeK [Candidatus Poribacteria bacterium]|nr:bis(5'-nucleosyl)-tetraphosphatase (symmetrical) YqeK [Candidatus Poribacteria bacterium]
MATSKKTDLLAQPKAVEIEQYLRSRLKPYRYAHVLSVQDVAIDLAERYKANSQKINLAALLHDCAKWMSDLELYEAAASYGIQLDEFERQNPSLLHAIVSAALAAAHFDVSDPEILSAIRVHTAGSGAMTLTDKILYVADFSEPKRLHAESDLVREVAYQDLTRAVFETSRYKIAHLLTKGVVIHPNTIAAYNSTLREINESTAHAGAPLAAS